jgi:hypothetical protein
MHIYDRQANRIQKHESTSNIPIREQEIEMAAEALAVMIKHINTMYPMYDPCQVSGNIYLYVHVLHLVYPLYIK